VIRLDHTLVSDDLKEVHFCCDLKKCKGACCIEGDAGAPLEEEEISLLEDYLDQLKPFMEHEGVRVVEEMGVFDYDAEGNFVTPLVNDQACAYVYHDDGIARCSIEMAFQQKIIPFPKPISCHLYPVRLKSLGGEMTGVNYHKWSICQKALERGAKEKMPLYIFLQEALTRKFGRRWYNRLAKLLH